MRNDKNGSAEMRTCTDTTVVLYAMDGDDMWKIIPLGNIQRLFPYLTYMRVTGGHMPRNEP